MKISVCLSCAALQRVDPLTGGDGRIPLVPAVVKGGICLGLVFASFVCFAQAARYFVHLVCHLNSPGMPSEFGRMYLHLIV